MEKKVIKKPTETERAIAEQKAADAIKRKKKKTLIGWSAAMVAVAGMITGMIFLTQGAGDPGPAPRAAVISGGVQTVQTTVTSTGYGTINVKAGTKVSWTMNYTGRGCIAYMRIPDFGISKTLSSGANVITFTPTKKGTYTVRCTMGMYTGKIIVS
jgi:Uncharacterized protein conserved in bacteria